MCGQSGGELKKTRKRDGESEREREGGGLGSCSPGFLGRFSLSLQGKEL